MAMTLEQKRAVAEQFAGNIKPSGYASHTFCGYDELANFIVKSCANSTWDVAQKWDIKGLFISKAELSGTPFRPYIKFYYVMRCGKVVALIVPKSNCGRVPDNFTVVSTAPLKNIEGVRIAFDDWFEVGHVGYRLDDV